MEIADRASLQWHDFADFPAALLYEVLRFRQAIFVVEQASPYPDLDGQDERAHHLLLRVDGELAGYIRLIPHPGEARVAIGRVAVTTPLRRQGLARRLMETVHAWCTEHEVGAVALNAAPAAQHLYRTLGYVDAPSPMMWKMSWKVSKKLGR